MLFNNLYENFFRKQVGMEGNSNTSWKSLMIKGQNMVWNSLKIRTRACHVASDLECTCMHITLYHISSSKFVGNFKSYLFYILLLSIGTVAICRPGIFVPLGSDDQIPMSYKCHIFKDQVNALKG